MTFIDEQNFRAGFQPTTAQRWSHYFAIIFGILAFTITLNLKQNIETATTTYINNEFGITALYPQNWLLEESGDDYVFQVQNVQEIGFKTTFRVNVQPIGSETTKRTLLDTLAINRSQTFAAYRILSVEPYDVLDTAPDATRAIYVYVDTNENPFIEQIPTVVTGIDILTINRGQAIVISMLSDANRFTESQRLFETFIRNLEF